MKIRDVSQYFSRIEDTTLRNEKTAIFAEMINKLSKEEMGGVIYISLGRLGPLFDKREFNLAERMVLRAISYASGISLEKIEGDFKILGDVGDVVSNLDLKGEGVKEVSEIYGTLIKIADQEGAGSQERKIRLLGSLLRELDSKSQKFIVRLVAGKLRLGFSDMTVLDALSYAKKGDKTDRKILEDAFNVSADMAEISEDYISGNLNKIIDRKIKPGTPIRPAKAERLGTIDEIVKKLGEISVEPKYDGMRVQIHGYKSHQKKKEGLFELEDEGVEVRIFSRGMEDISHMFPEIVKESIEIVKKTDSNFVIDAETIGINDKGNFLPFQETIKRKRKHGIGKKSKEIPLKVFAFDLLYRDRDLLREKYGERRSTLEELLRGSSMIVPAEYHVMNNGQEVDKLLRRYLREGLEGIMCKKIDSVYQAGARNFNWIKYKKAHEGDLADSLDCIVMGGYLGKGKRQKFGIGAFLVGVKDGEEYATVAKIGTGLTDEQWIEIHERMSKIKVLSKPAEYKVHKNLYPDFWVDPKIVVEVEADEVTKSPIHSSSYALRFPRLLRFRDDKGESDITDREEVKNMNR